MKVAGLILDWNNASSLIEPIPVSEWLKPPCDSNRVVAVVELMTVNKQEFFAKYAEKVEVSYEL